MEYDKVVSHFGSFLPFYPPNNPENQNFHTTKKRHGDIIVLHKCVVNDSHMMVSFFEIWSATDRIFYHLEPFLLSFYHFTQVYQKSWSWAILFLRYGAWWINCFLFWAIFCTFNPSNSPKIFFLSKEHLEISSFLIYVPKWSDDVRFLRYGARQTSGKNDI